MSGTRQAALLLHGLAARDREWMLAQLNDGQAGELRALLDELQALGIPADADLIGAASRAGQRADMPDAPAQPGAVLATAAANRIHALLAAEPDRLVALAIASSAWPWKERVLSLLGEERSLRIRELAMLTNPGPQARRAVLRDLAERLATLPASAGASENPPEHSRWTRLRRRMLQRLRPGEAAWRR
jgi:hypothetical protein